MKKVTLIYVIDENGKNLIGVGESIDSAIKLFRKSGYGADMSNDQIALFSILGYTTNLKTNFKLETWEVH